MIQDQLQAALANRYQVERELGRGGMATVFLATDIRHDRQVAIKVLHPELAATIGTERFEREIRLAAKLQHPHILGLIDSGAANGLLYYVMPFVEGESVRDKLDREKQLSVDEAVQITLEVADALGYAHAQSIVHRDIKPENVMMSNGHALVADFGIARARNDAGYDKLTLTGIAVGTPTYMSPEQATGENVGPAADLYSLGCMLYEMLAGEPPFSGPNPMAIMARHAMEAVPSIRIIRSSVPEEVEEAILAAMEKNVADRPKTAADFSEILGTPLGATVSRRVTTRYTARHRVPTAAMLTTSERRAARPWWRRPGVIAASFAVLAAGSIAAWSVLADTSDATPALDARAGNVAVLYFDSPDPAFADVADRLTEALIRDLSQVDRDLKVVSQAGVSQFRGSTASRDSIARVLEAGTLVTGEVVQRGDFVEVNTRVYDASGAPLDAPRPVRVAQDSLFQAEEKVAREVAENLRRQLGMTFSIREARAGAGNATSWRFYSRADRTLMQAQDAMSQVHNASDRERVSALFDSADSLARLSRAGDEAWIDPLILRSEIALRRRGLESDPAAQRAWLDSADVFAHQALAIDPRSGKALVLRGQVTYARSSPLLATDAKLRAQLLDSAQKQLEVASSVPDVEAEAYATLSYLHFDKKDVASSLIAASKAFEADRFLTNTSLLLNRMFWGYYNTQAFERAWNSCDEGARRFPTNAWFAECALWLELNPRGDPDTAAAWRLKAKVDSLTSEPIRQLVAQMIVAGVIGRVGKETKNTAIVARARQLLDEAAASGRADARIDPRGELPGYEAIMLVQMGDIDGAIDKLRSYVAANPDHSFRIDGDVHWWWRDLDRHPGFKALLDRTAR